MRWPWGKLSMAEVSKIRQQIASLTAATRVANGAQWLDENFPGWASRIDRRTLRLSSGTSCICGQLFREEARTSGPAHIARGGYSYATAHLFPQANSWISGTIPNKGLTPDNRAGLVSRYLGFMEDDGCRFSQLQDEWEIELTKRQQAVSTQ